MYKRNPIQRGKDTLRADANSLAYSASRIGNKEDDALVAAVEALELERYRIAKQAQDFAAMLKKLPRCPLCGHMADAECPHEDCIAEERERADFPERFAPSIPA